MLNSPTGLAMAQLVRQIVAIIVNFILMVEAMCKSANSSN